MDELRALEAASFGIAEGLTEFIPVSSTAHLLIFGRLLGFESPNHAFEIMIQFGAILALILAYANKLSETAQNFQNDPNARYFLLSILIAFLPAVLAGLLFGKYLENLLSHLELICLMLILGGVVLLLIDRMPRRIHYVDPQKFPLLLSLLIGICQCLAMVPGVSRSGATIVGALCMGADKRAAAEFSFFLAIPTMAAAFSYKFYHDYHLLSFEEGYLIAIGLIASFFSALIVVRYLLRFVAQHGYAPFALWRILIGSVTLLYLQLIA